MLVFLIVSWWTSRNLATPEGDQAAALFGSFAIGREGYIGIAATIIIVSILTMLTSRLTVIRQLKDMDSISGSKD